MSLLCDIHNHLLPAVDDGSRNMEESLRHLSAFRAQGCTDVVLTPHLLVSHLDEGEIEESLSLHRMRFAQVMEVAGSRDDLPRLLLGQEILAPSPADVLRIVDRVDVGLGGAGPLLVEFGFSPGFDGAGVVRAVVGSGRTIVVAHPERYDYGDSDPIEAMRHWKELGAWLQINGASLMGRHRQPNAQGLARRMLSLGLADIVASDHHGDYRPHEPAVIARVVEAEFGEAVAERLTSTAPRELLPRG